MRRSVLVLATVLAVLAPTGAAPVASFPLDSLGSTGIGPRFGGVQEPDSVPQPPKLFELPSGPLDAAVRALDPHAKPHAPPAGMGQAGEVPSAPKDAWSKSETWSAWSELLARETHALPGADPERRTRLALLALEQKRFGDAWTHVEAVASSAVAPASSEWIAALLPRFLPGVPPGSPCGAGGLAGPLPDGVVLTPSLPPKGADVPPGRVDRRAMRVAEVHVGAAVIAVRVAVEAEGVQIDVHHVSGASAKLSILIPEPEEFAFANEYVDWFRQEEIRVAHAIEVKAGDEDHVFYGRFEPRALRAPTRIPSSLPAQLKSGKLWLVVAQDERDRALFEAIARALSSPALGIECALRAPGDKLPGWSGTSVDLTSPAERTAKLVWLASAVEHFLLAKPAPTGPR